MFAGDVRGAAGLALFNAGPGVLEGRTASLKRGVAFISPVGCSAGHRYPQIWPLIAARKD
jgi:hypothetical protein